MIIMSLSTRPRASRKSGFLSCSPQNIARALQLKSAEDPKLNRKDIIYFFNPNSSLQTLS